MDWKKIWKQYVAWAIALKHNIFWHARIKLTVWYSLIIFVIISIFSSMFYYSLAIEIRDNILLSDIENPILINVLINQTLLNIRRIIIIVDGGLLIVTAGLGYFLAGKTLQPIQAMLQAQQRFIADASHELRTPLTIIKTTTEVALRQTNPADFQQALISNLEEVNSMSKIVEDLLWLAKHQQTKPTYVTKNVSLIALANNVGRAMRPLALKKNIKLIITTAG
ncbi:MAG: histidine kinase dimerization/phospho-acceptor domain-containing protein, partial [Patescibacteria group bacterium]